MTLNGRAIVIGAGIAGLTVAAKLAERGLSVTIVERCARIADLASGNAAGILSPYVLSHPDRYGEYLSAAFAYSSNWLEHHYGADGPILKRTGIVQLPATRRIARMIAELQSGKLSDPQIAYLDGKEASERSGIELFSDALFYPQGGWVTPRLLCERLYEEHSHQLSLRLNCAATQIVERPGSGWTVLTKDRESLSADLVVIANAFECSLFEQSGWLALEQVRGLIALGERSSITRQLRCVVCHNGYLIPSSESELVIGTTYRHGVFHAEPDKEEEAELARNIKHWMGESNLNIKSSRVCFRTSTPDRLPFVGQLTNSEGDSYPGLFVTVGHGSRGLVSAPFAAALIAELAVGTPTGAQEAALALVKVSSSRRI